MPAFLYVRMEEFMRSTDNKKDNKVLMSLRIYAEDKEQIEEKARKTGLTTSEYIRRCALGRKLPDITHNQDSFSPDGINLS